MTRLSFDEVHRAAAGRWPGILAGLGIEPAALRNVHGACPGCEGRDRFRFDDRDGRGTWICGGGGDPQAGDGFALLTHVHGYGPADALRAVAGYLGIEAHDLTPERGPRPAAGKRAAWAPVQPVPRGVASPPSDHYKLGAPARRWEYRDADGELLGYICRFDTPSGKEIRPLVFAAADGERTAWRWMGFPAPRPLYGLDRLAQRPGAPVLVAEGEKAADAAGELLLDAVATTPMNGAKSPHKADWAPVAGRVVWVWPDNDVPGAAFADEVARLVRKAGAASVHVLRMPPADGEYPRGWDAYDAVAAGWTAERVNALRTDHSFFMAPLAEREATVAEMRRVAAGFKARGDEDETVRRTLNDVGNGRRLADRHGADLRYCHPWSKWLTWDGRRWALDQSAEIMRRAKDTAASIFEDVTAHGPSADLRKDIAGWAYTSHKRDRLNAMIELAKSEPTIPVMPEQLDLDGMLLCVQNGILDLRTGELRPNQREDFVTKLAPVAYDAKATAPTWQRFLSRIFNGKAELIAFLQRAVGYGLTGRTDEQCLFILHGTGANGKSTFLDALQGLLGIDYARQAAPDLLLNRKSDRHPTELADLAGARLVSSVETGEGRRLDENLVKQSTGGDRMKARRMREDFWEFAPTFKLWLATNHRPTIRGSDYAIWRRIRLIPFDVVIPHEERDGSLPEKLRAELPGILAWAMQGCLAWQREGLRPPAEVLAATEAYRTEQDLLGTFIADWCVVAEQFRTPATQLFSGYRAWCDESGEHAVTQTKFGMALSERGFLSVRDSRTGRKQWAGIGLAEQSERSEPVFRINEKYSLTKGKTLKSGSDYSDCSVARPHGAHSPAGGLAGGSDCSAARLWKWQAAGAPVPERYLFDAAETIDQVEAARRIAAHYRRAVARVWPAEQEANA